MGEVSHSVRQQEEWSFTGGSLFVLLHAGCLFVSGAALLGHAGYFQKVWDSFPISMGVAFLAGPLACLLLLQPSIGLTRFGRAILVLYVCWAMLMGLLALVHNSVRPLWFHLLMVLAPITVHAISVGVLLKTRRRA